MATVSLYGSRVMTGLNTVPQSMSAPGTAHGGLRSWTETVEAGAADSTGSVYYMAKLPSNARLRGSSKLYHDTLGATTCALDIGLYPVISGQFTADADALNDGIVASTSGTKDVIKDKANYGKQLWQHVSGLTVDPQCEMLVGIALTDAHLSSGDGTLTAELDYTLA